MRLAFLAYDRLAPTSGGNIYDAQLVDGLRALGDTVEVVVVPRPGSEGPPVGSAPPWAQALLAHDRIIEDQLIHPAALPAHAFLRAGGRPIVSLVHNLTSRQPRTAGDPEIARIERAYFGSVDAVVAVCESTLADLRACGGKHLPAIVAYAGRPASASASAADSPAALAARARQPGPLRVLFVGVVAPHKGLHRLLRSVAGLPRGDVTLDVAGWLDRDPAYVVEVRAAIAALGLASHVRLHGALSAPELQRLYRSSQLLALPSDRESYPLSGLEALGHGLPVLLTAEGGTDELIGDTAAGVVLPPDDDHSWTAHLARWQADREQLVTRALAARARFQALPTWVQTARRVREFLRTLTGPAGPAALPERGGASRP